MEETERHEAAVVELQGVKIDCCTEQYITRPANVVPAPALIGAGRWLQVRNLHLAALATTELNQSVIKEFRANQGKVSGPMVGMPILLLTMTGCQNGPNSGAPTVPIPATAIAS